METLTITKENAIKAFETTNSKGKKLLSQLLGEKVFVKDITELIDTVEAALKYNGKTKERFEWETERDTDAQKADKELEEIALALREGKELAMGDKWFYPIMRKPAGSVAGFSYVGYYCGSDYSFVGARHSVDTPAKAIYMGKKFAEIYTRAKSPNKTV